MPFSIRVRVVNTSIMTGLVWPIKGSGDEGKRGLARQGHGPDYIFNYVQNYYFYYAKFSTKKTKRKKENIKSVLCGPDRSGYIYI